MFSFIPLSPAVILSILRKNVGFGNTDDPLLGEIGFIAQIIVFKYILSVTSIVSLPAASRRLI